MKFTKTMLVAAILSSFSMSAFSAATEGTLNFNFSGIIPAKNVDPAGWSFVTADGTTPYVAPGSIPMTPVIQADETVVFTSNSEEFYIAPETGSAFTVTPITAQLVADPSVTGTSILPSEFHTVTSDVTINGVSLDSTTAQTLVTPVAGSTVAERMVLGAKIDIPGSARTVDGGNITLQTTIRFSADVAAL